MLMQPTLEKITDIRLSGLRTVLEEQLGNVQFADLSFEERFTLLVDQEWTRRQNTRLERRLTQAGFRQRAVIEDLDFAPSRSLDRRQILQLATGEWVVQHLNAIVTGATGVGKTYLICALGRSICTAGFSVRYERLSHLLHQVTASHADESWSRPRSLGLVRSAERYSDKRLEAAARRALHFGASSFKAIRNILESGLDALSWTADPLDSPARGSHNVRGREHST